MEGTLTTGPKWVVIQTIGALMVGQSEKIEGVHDDSNGSDGKDGSTKTTTED